jgi:triosephosphate isomerase
MGFMRTKLVVGNWKMHGGLVQNRQLLERLLATISCDSVVDVALCVPYPFLAQAQSILSGSRLGWGGQDVSEYTQGAYTGEVSAAMLADFSCHYVIVGHSERRMLFAETDFCVAKKVGQALSVGLCPILCVGETLEQRNANQTFDVIARQLSVVLDCVGVQAFSRMVIAYEPVWAIGTGNSASPLQAQEVHAAIRAQLAFADSDVAASVRLLYGGSVKPVGANELFAMPDIDGALVGGASLVAEDFLAICQAAASVVS